MRAHVNYDKTNSLLGNSIKKNRLIKFCRKHKNISKIFPKTICLLSYKIWLLTNMNAIFFRLCHMEYKL